METEEDVLNPTDAMKRHQLESWTQRRRPRGGDPIPLGDVLTSIPGTETDEDRQRQRKARSALLQDPARLERLFKVDFTEAARSQFGIGSVYVRKPARLRIAPFTSPILGNLGALRGIQRLPSEGIRAVCTVLPCSPFKTVFGDLVGA